MNAFVVDTHPLFWLLNETLRERSENAFEVLRMAEKGNVVVLLPTIVLLEFLWLLKKKGLPEKHEEFLTFICSSPSWRVVPLDMGIVDEVFRIHTKGLEMHDSIIVATARLKKASVLTNDRDIRDSKVVETVW